MSIEIVVFDIGNVLLEWNPERFFDARIGRERREEMFATTGILDMNDRVDMGVNFFDAIRDLKAQNPGWETEIQTWQDNWLTMASPAIPRSVRIMRALRDKGIPVYALSNFGVQTFEIANAHYDFLSEFDRPYISGHLQTMKPDARIYEILEEDSGADPTSLLFADDRADNIAAAAARGWQTHLFEHPEGFAKRLVAEGLLTEDEAR